MNYNIVCTNCHRHIENNEATTKKDPFLEHTNGEGRLTWTTTASATTAAG